MKLLKFVTMLVTGYLLLVSSLAQAMLPQAGVYEKLVDGQVVARMHVIDGNGTGDGLGQNLGTVAAPFIYLESYGEEAMQLATFWSQKTESSGAGEFGVWLDKKNTELAKAGEEFSVTCYAGSPFDDDPVVFDFIVPGESEVFARNESLNGKYIRNQIESARAGAALGIFVYEYTYNNPLFYDENAEKHYYIYTDYAKNQFPEFKRLAIKKAPKGELLHTLLLDTGLHFVMEESFTGDNGFHLLFTSDRYTDWAKKNLEVFRNEEDLFPSSSYVLQYLTVNCPEMTSENRFRLRQIEFYGGEGEGAIFTAEYNIERYDVRNGMLLVGKIYYSSHNEFVVKKYTGQGTIAGDEVRVRAEPDLNAAILTHYNKGTLVAVEGYVQDKADGPDYQWVRIRLPDGGLGYVYSTYVKGLHYED